MPSKELLIVSASIGTLLYLAQQSDSDRSAREEWEEFYQRRQ